VLDTRPVNEETGEQAMKKIVTALVFAAFAAAPAFAATHHKKADQADSAYAAATDPNVVIVDGKVVGADPDANIRLNLRRDPQLQAN
jgi:patatin-like phospholipase/acyl hydrolase